jgi:hypothetical protein
VEEGSGSKVCDRKVELGSRAPMAAGAGQQWRLATVCSREGHHSSFYRRQGTRCFDAKPSPAIKPRVRRPGIDRRARRKDTDGPAGNGGAVRPTRESAAHGRGRRHAGRSARTDGREPVSACVRRRTVAEPMWCARVTSRVAFALPRDGVSICPCLSAFYSKFCNYSALRYNKQNCRSQDPQQLLQKLYGVFLNCFCINCSQTLNAARSR